MRLLHRTRSAAVVGMVLSLVAVWIRGVSSDERDEAALDVTLSRAGERVEAFFGRAQNLVCTETVSIEPLDQGLTRQGFARKVESELHLWWDPGDGPPTAAAQARRRVLTVNRRPPKEKDPNNCTVPEQQETEPQPLSMLLPDERRDYEFTPAGSARLDGRSTIRVDFRQVTPVTVDVEAVADNENCISYELNGGLRGRLWFDSETHDVLRLEQHLVGMVDVRLPKALLKKRPGLESSWTLERWDTTIRFGSVAFQDPDESLVLPLSSTTMRITRGSGTPRLRTETKYANYKRFLTGGRVIGDE